MEKRDRRRVGFGRRDRLLILSLSFGVARIFAAPVETQVSSFEPLVGETVRVEFIVRDVVPDGVIYAESGIPPSFTLTAGRKERVRQGDALATVVTREWVAGEAGSYTLGPFEISAFGQTTEISPIRLTVAAAPSVEAARLSWKIASEKRGTGIASRIELFASFTGTVRAVSCFPPEDAIVERAPSGGTTSAVGRRIDASADIPVLLGAWDWTPLVAGRVRLPSAELTYVGNDGLERTILSEAVEAYIPSVPVASSEKAVPSSVRKAFSEATDGKRASDASVSVAAKAGTGDQSERLARLRRDEYASLLPWRARAERLEAESALGFGATLPVIPASWKPIGVIGAVLAFSAGFALRLLLRNSRRRWTYSLFFVSAALAVFAITVYTRDPGPAGVLRGASLYHVPDEESSVIDELPEGTAVRVGKTIGDWTFVRTFADLGGWVSSDAVISYSGMEQ